MNRGIKWILIVAGLLLLQTGSAQILQRVKAGANKKTILIGEQIQLNLFATVKKEIPLTVKGFIVPDSIAHFDIISKGNLEWEEGMYYTNYKQQIIVTSFDSGMQVFPEIIFKANAVNGDSTFSMPTNTIPILVSYDTAQIKDLNDIKPIIDEPIELDKWIYYLIAGVGLLALVAVVFFLRASKFIIEPQIKPETKAIRDPWREAMIALDKVRTLPRTSHTELKYFYSQLIDVFKIYLWEKHQIHSLKSTTGELLTELRQQEFPAEQISSLAEVLRMGDAVKFAKYFPAHEQHEQSIQTIEQAISFFHRQNISSAYGK